MERPVRTAITVAGAFWMALALSALAQDGLPSVRGSVQGRAGAPLPGTSVVAKSLSTGQTLGANTNARGEFEILALPPGAYQIEISRPGFLSQTRREVVLAVGQSLTLDITLQPNADSAASGPPGERISEGQLAGLPLNGRSYNQLATLQAGVADTSGAQASRGVGGGNLTVSGSRSSSNNFLLDGTNIMDTGNRVPRSAAGVQLGSDTVFQVQVFSANFGAEYGRGSGGVLNSITRSGTSQLHATLFEYFRNSRLDTRNAIDPGSDPPPFKRNQFGFTVTGPVKKDRTFFTAGFEAMRDRLTETDLSFFPDAKSREGIITDPAGNELRRLTISKQTKPYLDLYPIPNQGSVGQGFGINAAPVFEPTNENYWTVRLDHKLSDHDSFFIHYTFDNANSTSAQGTFQFRTNTQSRQQYLTLVGTHLFSLRTLMAFRFGYTRPVDRTESLDGIGISRDLYFVRDAPQFGQIDIPGIAAMGPTDSTPAGNTMNTFQFADDVVAQRGPHALKFGADVHRYRWDVFNSSQKGAVWSFSSLDSFLSLRPEKTSSLGVALPGSDNSKAFRQTFLGLYLQDNYRVSPRLQLSLGMRYELASIIRERDGRLVFLPDPVHDRSAQPGDMLRENPSRLNFSPRVGLTWSPEYSPNTVVSAGFGIYADPLLEYVIDFQKNTAPHYRRAVIPTFDASSTFPDAVRAALENPLGNFEVDVLDYNHMRTPAVLRYTLAIQQELAGGLRVQAAYVGARGNHLFRGYEANLFPVPITGSDGSLFFPENSGPVNPAFGAISMVSSDAQSFYNALQISANQTLGRGITVQGNYTYSKSVDDVSSYSPSTGSRQYPLIRTLERGLSDFNIRHRFSVNYLYTLPVGRGQRWLKSGVLSEVLGGWRVGGILSFRTGIPFTPRLNVRKAGFLFMASRPNLLPGQSNNPTDGVTAGCGSGESQVPAGKKLRTTELFFDPCVFSVPEPGTLGNVGRNTIIGPGLFGMDISVQKDFVLGGERRLQFRTELFNLPNHPNYLPPSTSPSIVYAGSYPGRLNSTVGILLHPASTSRQIQLALRLSF